MVARRKAGNATDATSDFSERWLIDDQALGVAEKLYASEHRDFPQQQGSKGTKKYIN